MKIHRFFWVIILNAAFYSLHKDYVNLYAARSYLCHTLTFLFKEIKMCIYINIAQYDDLYHNVDKFSSPYTFWNIKIFESCKLFS